MLTLKQFFHSIEGERVTEYKIDKKRASERNVIGEEYNRIHISDQNIPEPIMYRCVRSLTLYLLFHCFLSFIRIDRLSFIANHFTFSVLFGL